jgi:hypothetical protein|tara:strand:- start:1512 stop:1784 length:273 start_codon:yes stop_codon:yes gene_type:complete
MLKILMVAVMVGIGQYGQRDLFVFTNPSFDTTEECVSYVQQNTNALVLEVAQSYGYRPVESILCINSDKIPADLLSDSPNEIKREVKWQE